MIRDTEWDFLYDYFTQSQHFVNENTALEKLFKNIVLDNANIIDEILIRAKQSQYIILVFSCFLTVIIIVNSNFRSKSTRKLQGVCIFMCFTQIVITIFSLGLSQNSTEAMQ